MESFARPNYVTFRIELCSALKKLKNREIKNRDFVEKRTWRNLHGHPREWNSKCRLPLICSMKLDFVEASILMFKVYID